METKLLGTVLLLMSAAGLCSAQCPLDDVVANNPQCQYATGSVCTGLNCTPSAPFQGFSASFRVVDSCSDPVQVELTVAGLEAVYRERFVASEVVQFGGDTSVSVEISRNATHLDFQATIYHNATDSVPLFPESLIPLNPADCMCSSLESLATSANSLHPLIESNCVTMRNCTSVRCSISVIGFVYFVEVVVLPCVNGLEFLVEDENLNILVADMFQGPGNATRLVTVAGILFAIEVDIIVRPYSMIAQVFLGTPLGSLDLTPQQNINLDRTQCNIPEFPTIALPTRLPPPKPAAPDAPSVCISLSNAAFEAYARTTIFRCELRDKCESGLACVLYIGRSEYKVDINTMSNSVVFAVVSADESTRYGGGKNVNITVALPIPDGTDLMFGQTVKGDQVGFMLQLRVSFLTSGQQTEELIPYTVISFPSSTNLVAIIVPVIVVLLVLVVGVVVIVVIIVFFFRRGKSSKAPFDFQKMSDLQEKELENYVEGDINNPFPRTPVETQPTKEAEDGEDAKMDLSTNTATTV